MKTINDPDLFFENHTVFRIEELTRAHPKLSRNSIKSLLAYRLSKDLLVPVRRGVYATSADADPLAGRLEADPDSVLAYDGALAVHQLGGHDEHIAFLTRSQMKPFSWEGAFYSPIRPRAALGKHWRREVIEVDSMGQSLFVTSIERTLVDLLDRLDLVRELHPIEAVHRFLKTRKLDLPRMVDHALALGNRVTVARLGFLLEHLERTKHSELDRLAELAPTTTCYLDRVERDCVKGTRQETEGVYLRNWRLVVPKPLWIRVARTVR